MTFEEAKKILKKEGFHMVLANKVIYQNGAIREFEKPEVCEAIKVANENRLTVGLTPTEWDEREARLKKKHEENTKDPDSAENHIKEDSSENPALAESASQFNGALLDEQGKKIKRLGKEIAKLNGIIHKKNLKIEELRKESSRHLRGKMKMFGENFDLEQELKDKNAVLSDVAEELRLSKIREKNLTEVCQKYMKDVEDLREQLANKVVDKINANALKSAESALAWKEKKIAEKDEVIAELREKLKSINMNRHNERICKKQLAEKDEVIADLGNELAEANKHQQQAYRSCADKNKEIRALKLQISALEKRGNGIDWKRNADAIKLYVNRASHERLWSPISQDICNEQELSFIINHGGNRVKYALRFDGTDIVYECSDPDKKPSFFRDDSVGAVSNQKDCSPVKDTHSTEDNPEEIEIEKAVKLVRKAMKEGCTVTIDYKG